jgi:hypothetical protein
MKSEKKIQERETKEEETGHLAAEIVHPVFSLVLQIFTLPPPHFIKYSQQYGTSSYVQLSLRVEATNQPNIYREKCDKVIKYHFSQCRTLRAYLLTGLQLVPNC